MPLISLFTSNFKPIGNSFRERVSNIPVNDFEYVIIPNNDLTYILIPDNDLFNTFIVDNDIQYVLLPDNDINNVLLPSNDIIYRLIPNSDLTYTLIPNNDLEYTTLRLRTINLETIASYLRNYMSDFRNPDFYSYELDGNGFYIDDGGGDMYDEANATTPWLISNVTYTGDTDYTLEDYPYAINYENTGTTETIDTSFRYISLGYDSSNLLPLTVIGTRDLIASPGTPIGFQCGGNIGSDGNGNFVDGNIYTGNTVSGYTVHSYYRQTYDAGDPSVCDVFILLGHPNWNSSFGDVFYGGDSSNQGCGSYLYTTGGNGAYNVLAIKTLLSKDSGVEVTFNEIKTVVDNFILRINESQSNTITPSPTPTPSVTPTMSETPTPTPTVSETPTPTPTNTVTPTITPSTSRVCNHPYVFDLIDRDDMGSGQFLDNLSVACNSAIGMNNGTLHPGGYNTLYYDNVSPQVGDYSYLAQNSCQMAALTDGYYIIQMSGVYTVVRIELNQITAVNPCPTPTPTPTVSVTPTITPTTTTTPTITPTPTPTLPPLNFSISSSCTNNGTISVSNFVGVASNLYEYSAGTHLTENSALNSSTWQNISSPSSGIVVIAASGTYWVAVRDAANTSNIIAKSVTINCVTPTPTSTITPTPSVSPSITPSITPTNTITPTSTLPPLGFTIASTCTNNGSITISNLVGVASGQYQFGSGTHTTENSALNSPSWQPITGGSSGLVIIGSSGTYWVAVREAANNSNILAKSVTINCVTPTPTSTITPTPSITSTITPTPTTSPIPVTGYPFNLVVEPYNFPTTGNTIMNNGAGPLGSTDPNTLSTISRGIYWNTIDSNGIDRTSYFSQFTGQTVTVTMTQDSSTVIYSGDTTSFKYWNQSLNSGFVFGTNIGVPPSNTASGAATLIQSGATWTVGQPVYISVEIIPDVTPTTTPTSTTTPTPTNTPTNTVTPTNSVTPTPSITPTNSVTPTMSMTPTPSATSGGLTTNNLILYYDPSNSSSYPGTGTTITDLSGNGRNGTMSNITHTSPYFTYNGTSSQISVADNALLEPGSGDWTIEVWVNQSVAGNDVVLGKFNAGGLTQNVGYSIRTTSSTFYGQFSSGSGSGATLFVNSTNHVATIGTWYQLVYVFTNVAANTLQTFVNGTSIGSVSHSLGSILNTSTNLYIGSYNNGEYAQWFDGKIGITRLYNKALTSSEVLNNYNTDKSKYGL